ncbi:MAG: potassium transporter TrkG [Nannocystaceae bacterium]
MATPPERPDEGGDDPAGPRERLFTRTAGALLAIAPTPVALALHLHGPLSGGADAWILVLMIVSAASLLLGAASISQRPRLGRVFAAVGLFGALGLAAPHLLRSPMASLAVGLALLAGFASLTNLGGVSLTQRTWRRPVLAGMAQGSALGSVGALIFFGLLGSVGKVWVLRALALSFAASALLALAWAIRRRREHPRRAWAVLGGLAAALVAAALGQGGSAGILGGGVLFATVVLVALPRPPRASGPIAWWDLLVGHPERLFVGTFLGLSLVGSILLALPICAASDRGIALLDAAFTAVSAVCVTGLVVLDTPVDFTFTGQLVILVLIQLGGLGIMTFSTAALRLLGRRMSLRAEGAVARLLSLQDRGKIFASAQQILIVTAAAEGLGALALAIDFAARGDDLGVAIWRGLFTAISAFCNAGFALQSASLVPYAGDPIALHVIGLLIIAGGLSPAAIVAIPALLRRRSRPQSAQIRLALITTALLLAVGFGLILAIEWDHALQGLGPLDRLHNAWFQSITLRTAGFNSIDLTALRPATLALMMALMFVGGAPGGTAGGVKVTTLAILWLMVRSGIHGTWQITVFGRRIAARAVLKAGVIVTLGISAVLVATTAFLLTQSTPTSHALFEVISALATVGLSLGATAHLDEVGKVLILACMFIGRVGALTILMILSHRRPPPELGRPEEDVDVG